MAMIERESWCREERQRVTAALARARFWRSIEPHKVGFWDAVDETLLTYYPDCRYKRNAQATLDDFRGGDI
ncbi:hypothetical protein NDI54_20645 [Haloarcula sp. S1AR25-5A]|uniref:Uncharacterized protein n=1 Tax=Haloarcula terrestris TaxID=2950533 RepID=A0AAE4F262_9EURY|nr:hypothetical protein [Haloarcula terrestris]MDS0223754.1 hypothetical protein [Haloarcula terrestris]